MDVVVMGLNFKDPEAYRSRAIALLHDKAIKAEDAAAITAYVLHNTVANGVHDAWGEDREAFRRDFMLAVKTLEGTGLPGLKANALVLAWALQLLQHNIGCGGKVE